MGRRRKGSKKPGRKRRTVVLLPGQEPLEPKVYGPTPETRRRKELLVGSGNPLFSDSPLGLLFVNGAIGDATFRAACRYAWLNRVLYGHRSVSAVIWDGMRPSSGSDFEEPQLMKFRGMLDDARKRLHPDVRLKVDGLVLHEDMPPWLKLGFVDPVHLAASRTLERGLETLRQWYDHDRRSGVLPEMKTPAPEAAVHLAVDGEVVSQGTVEVVPLDETSQPYKPNPVVHEDARTKMAHVRQALGIAESRQGTEVAAEC